MLIFVHRYGRHRIPYRYILFSTQHNTHSLSNILQRAATGSTCARFCRLVLPITVAKLFAVMTVSPVTAYRPTGFAGDGYTYSVH